MVAIFVLAFVLVLLSADLIIQARKKKYPLMAAAPGVRQVSETLRVPQGVFFHPGHTWARMRSGDKLFVGMDDFIQKSIGVIEEVILPTRGQKVRQGDPVITVRTARHNYTMVAPVTGVVTSVNHDAAEHPALIQENPYGDGWLFTVQPENLGENLSMLRIAEKAVDWVRGEVGRFRDFVAARAMQPVLVGETMLDGGVPVAGALEHLDDSSLAVFEQEFLR